MHESWFSPYPILQKGLPPALEDLDNMDKEIDFLETILLDSKEQRKQARVLPKPPGVKESERYSEYLTMVENQRRAEMELSKLQEERLKLVLIAGLAFDPSMRGDYFPHPTVEHKAKESIQTQNGRLLAVSTVAFFGIGITFSTIFSGSRGSIGLMSVSWAAFSVSFSLCVFTQWVDPESLPFAIVAYPGRRAARFWITFIAAFASFVGIVLMAIAVATLDLRDEGTASNVNTRINPTWGGIASLLPVVLGFLYGCGNLAWHGIRALKIRAKKSKAIDP